MTNDVYFIWSLTDGYYVMERDSRILGLNHSVGGPFKLKREAQELIERKTKKV